MSKGTLKLAKSNTYDQQDDEHEALRYCKKDLPKDYIVAKMTFTGKETDKYREVREMKKFKEDERRTT